MFQRYLAVVLLRWLFGSWGLVSCWELLKWHLAVMLLKEPHAWRRCFCQTMYFHQTLYMYRAVAGCSMLCPGCEQDILCLILACFWFMLSCGCPKPMHSSLASTNLLCTLGLRCLSAPSHYHESHAVTGGCWQWRVVTACHDVDTARRSYAVYVRITVFLSCLARRKLATAPRVLSQEEPFGFLNTVESMRPGDLGLS